MRFMVEIWEGGGGVGGVVVIRRARRWFSWVRVVGGIGVRESVGGFGRGGVKCGGWSGRRIEGWNDVGRV